MAETLTLPGSVDLHVHLREPSTTNYAETIYGGTRAALLGGFVLVADMPNNPGLPVWTKDRLDTKIKIAQKDAWIPIAFYAGSQPEEDNIGELEGMASRSIGLKLYGDPTTGNDRNYEAKDFREIVREWHHVAPEKPIMFHAGEDNLEEMIELVAGEHNHHLHVCHVNNSQQVDLVQKAKNRGLPVTCGVCPHHLLMSSHDVHSRGAFAMMKPPLAHQDEAEKLVALLEAGLIDVIESDFAPHTMEKKFAAENGESECFGIPGIEHIMPLLFYQVTGKGKLSEKRLIEATTRIPAEILGVEIGSQTSVTWDMSKGAQRIGEDDVEATCGWTPYLGMLAIGRVQEVKIAGQRVIQHGALLRGQPMVVENRGTVIA